MYKNGGFMAGAGVDILTLKPRTEYTDPTGVKMLSDELVTSFTPTAFFSYKENNWGIKGRVTYAQNASHLNMLSGYGVTKVKDNGEVEYGSLNSVTAWLDITYKQQLEKGSLTYCLFGGYGKNLGCEDDFVSSSMMYVRGYKNIDNFWRVAPSVLYTHNAMQIGLEYEHTAAAYGKYKLNMNEYPKNYTDGTVTDTHWVGNNRICVMLKYDF
jgi:hypothetical protein